MTGSSVFPLLLSSYLLCTFLLEPAHAIKKSYVVYLGSHSHGPNPSSVDMESATDSHYDLLGSVLGSHEKAREAIIYSYNKHINGFAALLEEEEAAEIKKKPNVVSVFLNKMHQLHTTRSWEFLGLEKNRRVKGNSAWTKGHFGQNIIIGNIDTGVWPESKSFSDKGYGPVPSKWRGGGICQINNLPGSNTTLCNRKLIGARIFHTGYESLVGKIDPLHHNSARDIIGHGTHTLSTAGGNFVRGANIFGNGNGTAKGGSPRARIAAYKVCWSPDDEGGCADIDLLSAFDQAINDGVDILSVSVGGNKHWPEDLWTDGISIGSFHAVAKGILVVASAGNEGPEPSTVKNAAPWTFTIAASSIDREFSNNVTLGNKKRIRGTSLTTGLRSQKFYPFIRAADAKLPNATVQDAELCKAGTLDPNKVKGKILICQQGRSLRPVDKGLQAKLAGAEGMILENDGRSGHTVTADVHVLATSTDKINPHDLNPGASYSKNPIGSLGNARTFLGIKPAPVIASFSSRGPNVNLPSILKPDVTAPGLSILAAFTLGASPTNIRIDSIDKRRVPFNVLSGTSMSCPHVAGIAGLLKTRHPNWSPAAIKSAIMTTATILDNTKGPILDEADDQIATPFAFGSGHVSPNLAIDPGLVYDLKPSDYLNFLCASGYEEGLVSAFNYNKPYKCPKSFKMEDFNYPSITLSNVNISSIKVARTVTNVGPPSTYSMSVKAPRGVKVLVQPSSLTFTKTGEKKTFRVIIQVTDFSSESASSPFGELSWTDGKHRVRSPIVVIRTVK